MKTPPRPFIVDHQEFLAHKARIKSYCRIDEELPAQVFREDFKRFAFEEFDWAMSLDFWPAIQELARLSNDTSLLIAVIDPKPSEYYYKEFGFYNWAVLPVSASSDEYWSILNHYPEDSPADSLLANSEKVVWFAPSGRWIVWGERSFEMCILAHKDPLQSGTWHDVDWALNTCAPNCFRDRIVSSQFAERLRQHYG